MPLSRRDALRLTAGASAAAAFGHLAATHAVAQAASGYRALVVLFLYGGVDSYNMFVPTGAMHEGYAQLRGPTIALPQASLAPLQGAAFGMHPAMAPLSDIWAEGAMSVALGVGSLIEPMDRARFQARPDLRPPSLLSHSHQQLLWEGDPVQGNFNDGFLGRIYDRDTLAGASPSLFSFSGTRVAVTGRQRTALVLPATGGLARTGFQTSPTAADVRARQDAIAVFADSSSASSAVLARTGADLAAAFRNGNAANAIITAATSPVDQFFRDPVSGASIETNTARQLRRVARLIASAGSLSHQRQIFFTAQGGYDTHGSQVAANDPTGGNHRTLLTEMAVAVRGFYQAMKSLGLGRQVALAVVSDFGRTYPGNASLGTDHAWSGNYFVVSEALRPRQVLGRYPSLTFGGADDSSTRGTWIPAVSIEEYLGALAQWYGVASADMGYVFPNWATWNGGGRGPLPLFA
jgi:uncharacterized protein (DUF1501 family)